MALTIGDDKKRLASIKPLDAKGQPAKVDGVPPWQESSDGQIVTLQPAADGMSCFIVGNNVGTAQVSVQADADLGPGVQTLTGTLDVEVTAGTAVQLQVNVGDEVPQ